MATIIKKQLAKTVATIITVFPLLDGEYRKSICKLYKKKYWVLK